MDRAGSEGAQRDGQHRQGHGQGGAQQQPQQGSADGARHAADHALHGALPGRREVGLQDEYQRQRHPVPVIDGKGLGERNGDGRADAHAQGMAERVGLKAQVLAQGTPGLPRAACARDALCRRGGCKALVEQGLHDRLGGMQQAVQHRHHGGQVRRIGHGAAAQVMQPGAVVRQPLAQAFRLLGVADVGGAGDGVAYAGVAVHRM
ncbi:hypothetical protein D3C85_1055570 [compost metagenome]